MWSFLLRIPGVAFLQGLPKWVQLWILVAVVFIGFKVWDYFDDRAAVKHANQETEIHAGKAREEAANERIRDTLEIQREEKELRDAVSKEPGGELSPAAHALACERLRRIGRIPPTCRPQSGN